MTVDKFLHLEKRKPDVQEIMKTPVELVDNEQLGALGNHFKKIQVKYSFDTEIVNAAGVIIGKIDKIMNLGNSKISGEVMKSANDENYNEKLVA